MIPGRLLVYLMLLFVLGMLVGTASALQDPASTVTTVPVDPNKTSSEFNHHMAGYALIGVGFLVLAGLAFPNLRPIQYLWPLLFILAGTFLAAWSDAEIWPRGNLSWAWLLHHDREAMQHKVYAILLIGLGVLEYLRAQGKLKRFWRLAAFPVLALVGATLLLFHDHTGGAGARSLEARAYLLDPARDADGRPWPANPSSSKPQIAAAHDAVDHDHMQMDLDHASMSGVSSGAEDAPGPHEPRHAHHMTEAMLLVQREHFRFMIVGIAIALFKLISDAHLARRIPVLCLWPGATIILGVLLALYHE